MHERTRPKPPAFTRWILTVTLLVLYVPLVTMVLSSFSEGPIGVSGFTLQWYGQVFQDPVLWNALGRSVIVAGGSALGATILGLLGALALNKWVFVGKWPLQALSLLSLMLPELVLALSLLSWYALVGLELSLATVILAHITLTLPFVILVIGARLKGLEPAYEDAARDLGAREWEVLLKVILPLLRPAIASAFLLAFLLSFDDFLVTFYTNGAGTDTLPVRLYSLMKTGLTPKIQALSSLMLLASVALIVVLVKTTSLRNEDRAR